MPWNEERHRDDSGEQSSEIKATAETRKTGYSNENEGVMACGALFRYDMDTNLTNPNR